MQLLADADALGSAGQGRRQAGWDVRRLPPVQLPLFAAADAPELGKEPDAELPAMPLSEEVVADYQTHRMSLKGHPMQFLRGHFADQGVLSCAQINAAKDGQRVRAAGVVLVRQRPGTGKAIFITIEDETGIVNALLWASEFEKQRRPVMASRLMVIEGEVQRSKENVVHLMASRVIDATAALQQRAGIARA
jgi:error-prone DNA polymerase